MPNQPTLRTESLPFKPHARKLILLGDQLIRDAGITLFKLVTNCKTPVSDTQAYKQFGNSVVIPVFERIAKTVAASLRQRPSYRPELDLELAEESEEKTAPKPK